MNGMNGKSDYRKSSKTRRLASGLIFIALVLSVGGIGSAGVSAAGSTGGDSHGGAPTAITCPGTPAQCFADVPVGNTFFEYANHVFQQGVVTGYACGGAGEPCDANNRPYYRPDSQVNRGQMSKFVDQARRQPGVAIVGTLAGSDPPGFSVTITGTHAIVGKSTSGAGVVGLSSTWRGLSGFSQINDGVWGESVDGYGVAGVSTGIGTGVKGISQGFGVIGESQGAGILIAGVLGTGANAVGVYGSSTNNTGVFGISANGAAGYFEGDVTVTGTCYGCLGPMQIDDPLDPAHKYLYQAGVASPDMMNIYNGNVTTDANGEAVVALPDYFGALNKDYRYQLTPIGQFAQVIVAQEIADNSFTIKTDKPNVKVSWQVTGVRQDAYANAHRTPTQVDKPEAEQGKYLHPTELGQPASVGINYGAQQKLEQGVTSSR